MQASFEGGVTSCKALCGLVADYVSFRTFGWLRCPLGRVTAPLGAAGYVRTGGVPACAKGPVGLDWPDGLDGVVCELLQLRNEPKRVNYSEIHLGQLWTVF
jgi:hypothetical protein